MDWFIHHAAQITVTGCMAIDHKAAAIALQVHQKPYIVLSTAGFGHEFSCHAPALRNRRYKPKLKLVSREFLERGLQRVAPT